MKHLDLFSGIGGFALAARNLGWQTVAFCEIDPFCKRVLAKHWPDVPIYDDVRKLDGSAIGPVDLITGGFPCQDVSTAGAGVGILGPQSGLWSEFDRLIGELRPRFAVVENVAALLYRGLDKICGDLAARGYDAEWSIVSACSVGASHMRRRVFLVAYPNGLYGRQGIWATAAQRIETLQSGDGFPASRTYWRTRMENPSELYGGANGIPNGLDRNRGIGNAIVPQIAEMIFKRLAAI